MSHVTRLPEYKLGSRLKDKVTGFEGIATSYTVFLNGCLRYTISPPVDKDGKMVEAWYIDEEQLELVDEGVNCKKSNTGGPSEKVKSNQL